MKITKAIKRLSFDMFLLIIDWQKKEAPNNQLKMKKKPMIRKQAYIKDWKNKQRKK